MEIHGLPPANNRIGSVENRQKTGSPVPVNHAEPAASGISLPKDRLEDSGLVTDVEFEPRTELITSVSRRISGSGAVAPNPAGTDRENVSETAAKIPEPAENTDLGLPADFYRSEEIIRQIAEKIAPVIDISGLFGGHSR